MEYTILGTVMPMVELTMQRGEQVYAQAGAMQWMTYGVKMDTGMRGGIMGALKRKISGEDMFVVNYTAAENGEQIAFGHSFPGTILAVDVSEHSVICQSRAFVCAQSTVDYDIAIQRKLGVGLFGGEGFVMQRLSGAGIAFIELDGECVEKELRAGEKIKVQTSAVGMFDSTVSMDIERIRGFKNMFLGGEGIFITTLTGPGRVWIQTMPASNLAGEISSYISTGEKK